MTAPIYVGAVFALLLGLLLGELVPRTNARRAELLEERKASVGTDRFNFAYASEEGRVYKVTSLNVPSGQIAGLNVERKGRGAEYPTYILSARRGTWQAGRGWTLHAAALHVVPSDSAPDVVWRADSVRDRRLHESPLDLMATPRSPQEMGYRELGRFIRALERSGGDANELRVERALKIAIPVTCLIIALFGAPLATSTQRGGAAFGVGISLATTIVFLMMIQLTKAIGGKGLIDPDLAAWVPNAVFAVIGLTLLTRVRT
jgi:lipopolysaccharide export system permease protein